MPLFIVKNFLHYMIPVAFITMSILFVLPFLGEGPIYTKILDDFFLTSCSNNWWANILLISNWYPFMISNTCASNITLISNEFQLIVILIPLLGYVYKNLYRRALIITFSIIGVGFSMVPVIWVTIANNV